MWGCAGKCYPVGLARDGPSYAKATDGGSIAMSRLDEEKPPFFGTWARLYAAVVGYLFFLILLFYAFTRAYQFPP